MSARSALAFSPGAAGPLLGRELDWQAEAPCQYTDPEIFFPPRGGSVRDAKRICAACPVQAICLQYAIENDERFGVWGGKSARQIARLRRRSATVRPLLCRRGKHARNAASTGADGTCRPCKRERGAASRAADRVARTGSSSPQRGKRLAA